MERKPYYNSEGLPVTIGTELGRGGEGTVFALEGDSQNVVKIYHTLVDETKAAKLASMATLVRPELLKIAAWPISTLHDKPNGPVRGLVMPRISGYREIHELYGPAHRKRHFPIADWKFLLLAARNVAAAFDVIHSCGHVVGDVNQGNVLVSSQAIVKLIDTDSFQISYNGNIHLCTVGMLQFTPPELQTKVKIDGFEGILRTTNHDLFGLAIMVFHLLFMGRHPFAGRYSGSEDMPIEKAISELRFAYGVHAKKKFMDPPPNTLPLSIVTDCLESLFERAFSDSTIVNGRPTAREWMLGLELLMRSLKNCTQQPIHKYPADLSSCPWCSLEQTSRVAYFLGITTTTVIGQRIDVTKLWASIEAVTLPYLATSPNISQLLTTVTPSTICPTPLPPLVLKAREETRCYRLVVASCGILVAAFTCAFSLWLSFIPLVIGAFLSTTITISDGGEFERRKKCVKDAYASLFNITNTWNITDVTQQFQKKKEELYAIRLSYEGIGRYLQAELYEKAFASHLAQHFIEDAKIPGIGKKRVAILSSWGIETAADIKSDAITRISGFGPTLQGDLMAWRKSIEAKFRLDLNDSKIRIMYEDTNQQIERKKQKMEADLVAGEQHLRQLRISAEQRKERLQRQFEERKIVYLQASADFKIFKK